MLTQHLRCSLSLQLKDQTGNWTSPSCSLNKWLFSYYILEQMIKTDAASSVGHRPLQNTVNDVAGLLIQPWGVR